MTSLDRKARALAAALAGLAGFIDAMGFLELGGFFVSFMSGNTTRLGVGLAGAWPDAALAAGLIAAFMLGVTGGVLIGRRAAPRRASAVLALAAAVIAVAAAVGAPLGAPTGGLGLAFAMGALNAAFSREDAAPIGVTYMTGALVRLGQALADSVDRRPSPGWPMQLALWCCMGGGAWLGALAQPSFGVQGLWLAASAAAILAAASLRAGF